MSTPFRTPRRPTGKENVRQSVSISCGKVKAVDLVTGKAKVEYFFDPSLALPDSNSDGNPSTPFRRDLSSTALGEGREDPLMFSSKHLFMPCTIIKSLEDGDDKANGEPIAAPTLVKTSDGTLHKIRDSTKLTPLTAPDDYVGVNDVLHLPNVTEACLVHTLRLRYKRDDIYTSAGPILLSINPYKTIAFPNGESLYSENQMMQYRNKDDYGVQFPPHLFQVADRAYSALLLSVEPGLFPHIEEEDAALAAEYHMAPGVVRNQSIIISGESGAGKTEATKYIMQYLARITKKPSATNEIMSPDGKMIAALEDRVLSSNPLLETFGNARTLRNDNSSRFGKFIHIYFSTETGTITGASISNYLLEKTRITHQIEGERNYHIFYQLLAGADDGRLKELGLDVGTSGFQYLGNRDAPKSKHDARCFMETMSCLQRIGLSAEDQNVVFAIAAAVLHLGNISFEEQGDVADEDKHGETENARVTEASRASLSKASSLLGLDEEKVAEAILTKLISVGGKTIHKPQSVAQAEDKRDAFAKLTYSCLFLWLVQRINQTLSQTSHDRSDHESRDVAVATVPAVPKGSGFIGVLDIYGFEVFETNGYEQLLINYCNEKLQRHFNRHLFEVEQDLYASEGVDWTYITFNDNRPCLELIEGGGGTVGILNTLDDAWGGMGTAAEKDVKFVSHLHKLFGNTGKKAKKNKSETDSAHKHYVTPKFGNDRQFIIVHYAGDVRYTANGFVEKNMETLSNELKDLGAESSIALSKDVFSCGSPDEETLANSGSRRSSIRGVSVASQFRSSLQALVTDLERTQPHYIRCMKPNLNKTSNALDAGEVLRQLRYSGMMEAIRIRREGYALREDHESFYNRFCVLLHPEDFGAEAGIEQLVKVLSKRLTVTDADWQIGHSKIFLRRELADKLERLAKLKVRAAARIVSRFGRLVAERRASSVLTVWVRFRLHMIKKHRRDRASSCIIAAYRRYIQAKVYAAMRRATIRLQSQQRRKLAVKRVTKLRDPYADMTFKQMQSLLRSEQCRLDDAVNGRQFKIAAEIESSVTRLRDAMEAKRPLTRSLLETQIEAVQNELDGALSRKAYEECGPLQEALEKLIQKRSDLPTIDELKNALSSLEADVAKAAERRDFSTAAAGQKSIDEARKRLEDTLAAESIDTEEPSADHIVGIEQSETIQHPGIESRAQLERDIATLNDQVKAAIASKDFQTASNLQATLDGKESLRQFFPTVEELEDRLAEAKRNLDDAISNRDFSNAGKLHDNVDDLEKKLAAEKALMNEESQQAPKEHIVATKVSITKPDGDELVFESRSELEDEISATTKRIVQVVASKDFKQAELLQSIVDKLEGFRSKLPSIPEIENQISFKAIAMDKAIGEKKFSEAEALNVEIETLHRKLSTETLKKGITVTATSVKEKKTTQDAISIHSMPILAPPVQNNRKVISFSEGIAPKRPNIVPPTQILSTTHSRPVSKLRPTKPVLVNPSDSVLLVAQVMAKNRSAAAIAVDSGNRVSGILTDHDLTRRVVAKRRDAATTSLSSVMTPNPSCVSMSDGAMDALSTMIEHHYRYLPVVDDTGAVSGLLDIGKCLNDAISKLEHAQDKTSSAASDAVKQMASLQGAGGAQVAALQALLGPLMSQAFGDKKSPTLRGLLAGKPSTIVGPTTNVQRTAEMMAEKHKAALVVEDGELVGILSFKDVMTRVIAKELPLEATAVSSVMTPNPVSMSPDATVLEALQLMHDHNFLTLPVCESDGSVVGIVDVMDLVYGCGGVEGWRSIFDSTMDLSDDEMSDQQSAYVAHTPQRTPVVRLEAAIMVSPNTPFVSHIPSHIPTHVEIEDGVHHDNDSLNESFITDTRGFASTVESPFGMSGPQTTVFKVTDPSGHTHRIRGDLKVSTLLDSLSRKMGDKFEQDSVHMKFVDDEGDAIMITTDEDLAEAARLAHGSGSEVVKLTITMAKPKSSSFDNEKMPLILAGIGAVVVAIGVVALVALKPRRG